MTRLLTEEPPAPPALRPATAGDWHKPSSLLHSGTARPGAPKPTRGDALFASQHGRSALGTDEAGGLEGAGAMLPPPPVLQSLSCLHVVPASISRNSSLRAGSARASRRWVCLLLLLFDASPTCSRPYHVCPGCSMCPGCSVAPHLQPFFLDCSIVPTPSADLTICAQAVVPTPSATIMYIFEKGSIAVKKGTAHAGGPWRPGSRCSSCHPSYGRATPGRQ